MTVPNPYPEGTGEWLLYEIFAERPQDEPCDRCGRVETCMCGEPNLTT